MADARRRGQAVVASDDLERTMAQVVETLARARRVLLTTHVSPDGDGIGSTTGLAGALEGLGKTVTLYSADPIPHKFDFLAKTADFVRELAEDARFDVSVVMDCADLARLGPHFPSAARRGTLMFIDHHATRGQGADVYFNDETSPAVGEIVLRIMKGLGAPLTPAIAECLHTSLVSDTGSFRYSNTSPAAMRCAAELLETGIDPWRVSSNLYESEPAARVHLLARALRTLDVSPDGRCAVLCVTPSMLAETGATPDMIDGFINHARAVRGVEVAVLFHEREGGEQKVSFRSRGNVNVALVAQAFGGGGHFHAAGCTVHGPVEQARARLYAAVQAAIAAPHEVRGTSDDEAAADPDGEPTRPS